MMLFDLMEGILQLLIFEEFSGPYEPVSWVGGGGSSWGKEGLRSIRRLHRTCCVSKGVEPESDTAGLEPSDISMKLALFA